MFALLCNRELHHQIDSLHIL